jgi:hypothetical protein
MQRLVGHSQAVSLVQVHPCILLNKKLPRCCAAHALHHQDHSALGNFQALVPWMDVLSHQINHALSLFNSILFGHKDVWNQIIKFDVLGLVMKRGSFGEMIYLQFAPIHTPLPRSS